MNVRARDRRGRTEIDPLCWRIPFQWQGYHYQDHDDQPFMLLVNSGGGFVEGDVCALPCRAGAGHPGAVHHHGIEQVLQVPGRRRLARDRRPPGGGGRAAGVLPGRGDPLRPQPGGAGQPDRAGTLRPALRHRHGLGPAACTMARARSSASTIWSRSSASSSAAARSPSTAWSRPSPRPSRRWSGCGRGGATWRPRLPTRPTSRPASRTAFTRPSTAVEGTEAGVTRIGQLVIVRILSDETWQAHEALFNAWAALRPAIAGKHARPIRKC